MPTKGLDEMRRTRRGILTIVVAVCAVSGAGRALAQEALPPCAAPQTKARVDGRSPQPTEQEARQAEIACGLGGPDLRDSKAAEDVDELYERLMIRSALVSAAPREVGRSLFEKRSSRLLKLRTLELRQKQVALLLNAQGDPGAIVLQKLFREPDCRRGQGADP